MRTSAESRSEELFRSKLRNIINLRHELVRSGDLINWARLEEHSARDYQLIPISCPGA